jgi:hypothetical protein
MNIDDDDDPKVRRKSFKMETWVKITTTASGCTTVPQSANVTVQYRMQ